MNIGAKIKLRREAIGMSVQTLSEKLGMTRQNIYNLESQKHINTRTLEHLCMVFETDLFWFLSENGEDSTDVKNLTKKKRLAERIDNLEGMIRILQKEVIDLKELQKKC